MEDNYAGSGMDSWPEPVLVYDHSEKLVMLTQLPARLKQQAWTEIKLNCPALAELLREEPLREIVEYFKADIFIESHLAPCLPQEPLRGRKA
jgi:hypothetical protein